MTTTTTEGTIPTVGEQREVSYAGRAYVGTVTRVSRVHTFGGFDGRPLVTRTRFIARFTTGTGTKARWFIARTRTVPA